MNVFVYHACDRDGSLLAEVLQRLPVEQTKGFQFLSVERENSMRRLQGLLGRLRAGGIRPPFVVVLQDLSGRAVEGHQIISGEALANWFHNVLQSCLESPGVRQMLRDCVMRHLSPPTLVLLTQLLSSSGPPPSAEEEPTPSPRVTGVPPAPRPTRSGPTTARGTSSAIPRENMESVSGGDPAASESTVWTMEATTPQPRKDHHVNIADVMIREGKVRNR